ncbi:MAG: GNAT family N-acetyltransferase [Sulfobacillus sp.]
MCRQVDSAGVVRLVDQVGHDSMVVYSRLGVADADRVIHTQATYFLGIGHNLEWKLYTHDQPADLHQRLLAHGFADEDPEAIMALNVTELPPVLGRLPTAQIRRCAKPEPLKDAISVYAAVWPQKAARLAQRLNHTLRTAPQRLSVYVAYVDGEPVSVGRIHFSPHSAFASLWGSATLPAYRGRGLYTQMLAVRLQEAIARNVRVVTVDAGPLSRPIVSRLGFRLLTWAQAHRRQIDEGHGQGGALSGTGQTPSV